MIDDVARQIVGTEHRVGGSFIRTPLLYPSGATVLVRIEEGLNEFFVSDMGAGHEEAELMGASGSYARQARTIAEKSGVGFDNQCFFVIKVSREQLPGAVVTIANCSQEAAAAAIMRHTEAQYQNKSQRLYERLTKVFSPKLVEKDAHFTGASSTPWRVAAIVRVNHAPTIFEPVLNNHNSIVSAAAKFHDISRLDRAPHRVAVVQEKEKFGTLLAVLAQAADVVDEKVPNKVFEDLAKAA